MSNNDMMTMGELYPPFRVLSSSPKGPSVEAPHTHHLSVKWSAFPNEIAPSLHTHSNFIVGTRLILHLQLQYPIWNPQLSRPPPHKWESAYNHPALQLAVDMTASGPLFPSASPGLINGRKT